ncbi:hypothetical protein F443_13588 [Phytophthora nicotianae P1569]|uniref:Uncharacterized protein n=1 Tax=Phytophthora nicotianae P1569 TaxID=1317065 RepID=V9EQH6_PHYNI|nr:hypothetical protein F443_13588 [Phytophthora nicotianae P1569]
MSAPFSAQTKQAQYVTNVIMSRAIKTLKLMRDLFKFDGP